MTKQNFKSDSHYRENPQVDRAETPWLAAVIDIGATSLRMQISEIHPDGQIRKLEAFSQAVSIGKDSFSNGKINKVTIEDCVHVLRVYRMKLDEYGIEDNRQLRVVATSGVKEAGNRLAFIDRIYVATGLEVELLDDAELHRVTLVGALPLIESNPKLFDSPSVICEVSGGTTEILIVKGSEVMYSQSYRQGSLRIRNMLQSVSGPILESRNLFEAQFNRMTNEIRLEAQKYKVKNLIAIGGDIRFAAKQILGESANGQLARITRKQLSELTDDILVQSNERLIAKYHLSMPEADSLGTALLAYNFIAKELNIESLYVASFNLRDGIVEEMAHGGKWLDSVEHQIIHSAIQLGQKFNFDQAHAVHVSRLACTIFDQLSELHELDSRFKVILEMASILHEIGLFVSTRSYHKHSLYLISHAEFFGISSKDVELVALVARYHRRAMPQPNHDLYSKLDRTDRVLVAKLAAILRIAKALDAARNQRIKDIDCQRIGKKVVIRVNPVADISLEGLEMKKSGQMFSEIFGTQVVLENSGA